MLLISHNVSWKVYSWINAYIKVIIIKMKYTEVKMLINKTSVILLKASCVSVVYQSEMEYAISGTCSSLLWPIYKVAICSCWFFFTSLIKLSITRYFSLIDII